MYYYIFASPKSPAERAYFGRIRDIVREFGISGEMTQASPARSPEELAKMGLEKGNTTIIAVGSDTHVNKIVSQVVKEPPNFAFALGIVATEPNSLLYERWGFKKPDDACEMLKFRRLVKFDVGLIEPDHYFLTSARIECKKPTRINLEVDHWKATAIVNRVEISGNLYILLERFMKERSIIKSALNFLKGEVAAVADRSIFRGRIIRISSLELLPVYVGDEVVAKTPVNIYRKLNALNIITKRDKMVSRRD